MTDSPPTGIIDWRDPVNPGKARTSRGRISRFAPAATQLRNNPGRWGVLEETLTQHQGTSLAFHIRSGQMQAFAPSGAFDATAEKQDDGTYSLFAKYVGDVPEKIGEDKVLMTVGLVDIMDTARRIGMNVERVTGRPAPEHDYRFAINTPTGGEMTFAQLDSAGDIARYAVREGWIQ